MLGRTVGPRPGSQDCLRKAGRKQADQGTDGFMLLITQLAFAIFSWDAVIKLFFSSRRYNQMKHVVYPIFYPIFFSQRESRSILQKRYIPNHTLRREIGEHPNRSGRHFLSLLPLLCSRPAMSLCRCRWKSICSADVWWCLLHSQDILSPLLGRLKELVEGILWVQCCPVVHLLHLLEDLLSCPEAGGRGGGSTSTKWCTIRE